MNETVLDFEGKLRAATKGTTPLPAQKFVASLRTRLGQENEAGTLSRRFQRRFIVRASNALVLLIVVLVALLGPSDVLAAIQRLMGYVPGVGFIQPQLILSEPLTVSRGNVSVTVENLVVSSSESVLVFRIEDPYSVSGSQSSSYRETTRNPYLQMPDGTIYQPLTGQGRLEKNGRQWRELIRFSPLPPDTTSVFFVTELALPSGTLETLQLELLLERGDHSPMSAGENFVSSATSIVPDEVKVRLDGIAIEQDRLVLNVIVDWENPNWQVVEVMNFAEPTPKGNPIAHFASVTDANGAIVPISLNTMESSANSNEKQAYFVFLSDMPVNEIAFPATLSLDAIYVSSFLPLSEQPVFTFFPKTNVIPGECETLLQSMVSNEIEATLAKVCYLDSDPHMSLGGGGGGGNEISPPQFGLELSLSAPSDIVEIFVGDTACRVQPNPCAGSASYSRQWGDSDLLKSVHLYAVEPNWPVIFSIGGFDFIREGPWSIEFELTD
ncbi:MAG: hypothetical protein KF698_07430 [Anaerolineales bacterium]|nr:hypothetical protein [Anaerolineales bacterium]